jgi:hypothetical protein
MRILKSSVTTTLLVATLLLCRRAPSQVLFSAGTYSQNFDTLATSGTANTWTDNQTLIGWYASKTNNGTPSTVSTYRAFASTDTAGALYSFGVAGVSPLTDRALGSIASGNATAGNFAYGVRFTNDTGLEITNIMISYNGEQWRNGGNVNTQSLYFSYRVSNTPIVDADSGNANAWISFGALDFKTPTVGATAAVLDGNAAANRQALSMLLPGVVVFPGQEIFFRWYDINDSGNDHAVGVDDLNVSFTTIAAVTNAPAIAPSGEPESRTNNAGTVATLTVTATGTAPTYTWRKDGTELSDGGKISGSATPTLTISNLLAAEAGGYDVIVTNGAGSVTSIVATLTVIDPAVNTQPISRSIVPGDTANFFAGAAGTPLLTYQWRFNGTDIPGANANAYNVVSAQSSNQGPYSVVVSNGNGSSVTSAVANLTVLSTPSNQLARWDFNSTNTLSVTTPVPSSGAGTASLFNGTTATFGSGTFSDPAGAPGFLNSGWNTTTYAPQGTSNKLRGVQFNVSTVGNQNILLTWEERHSDTASKYSRLQYSADGVNFSNGPVITMTATNNSFVFYSADLSAISSINNNPDFAFRFVPEFESTAIGTANDNYVATVTSYNTAGTIRFDLVTVFGNAFNSVSPIPLAIQQIGNKVILSWNDPAFVLQFAPALTATYNDVPGNPPSPYTNTITGTQTFFRLRH